jgi:hypothetical protein
MRRLILVALVLALASPAFAQAKRQPLTGNPVSDFESAIGKRPPLTGNPIADIANAKNANSTATPACTFQAFAQLTANNIINFIKACATLMETDSQAALTSAEAAKDTTAIACLTPGTALLTAAIGVPEVPGVPAIPATATTAEVPAVAAIPAKLAGPILIFQKFREFVMSAGLSNCNAWVNTTIASTIGSAALIPIPIP